MKYLLCLLLLFAGGCTFIQPSKNITLLSSEKILKKSRILVEQQRWGEAQLLLEQGARRFPNNNTMRETLTKVQLQWNNKKRRLEDWMLVYETEALLLNRPLLVSMTRSDPNDSYLKAKLSSLNLSLKAKHKQLLDCARNQFTVAFKLARRCIESAKVIHLSIEVQLLLNKIKTTQTGIKKKKQEEAALSKEESRNAIIQQAKNHLHQRLYSDAINILQPTLLQNNNDQEINILMEEAITGRDLQVLQLITRGDRLYREEHILEAMIIWEQAAVINPYHLEITHRINRAKKVLLKLKEIRAQE